MIDALMDTLGPVETALFLALLCRRRVDSVVRHRKWQATLDREELLAQVFRPDDDHAEKA